MVSLTGKRYYELKGSSELKKLASIKPSLQVENYDQRFQLDVTNGVVFSSSINERLQYVFVREVEMVTKTEGVLHLNEMTMEDPSIVWKMICNSYNKPNWEKVITAARQYRFNDLIFDSSESGLAGENYTFEEFFAAYKNLDPKDSKSRGQLFGKLRDAVKLSPEVLQHVCHQIENSGNDRALRQRLLDTLASVGTSDCQKALATYINNNADAEIRLDAIISSGVVTNPESVLIDAVMGCIRNRDSADLTSIQASLSILGAFAGRLDASDPQQKLILLQIMSGASDYQGNVGLLRAYFSAWSNTQLPEAKDRIVERIYPGASDSVWDGAIFALENLRQENAREVLIAWSADSTMSRAVQIRAIQGLANSELEPNWQSTQIISNALANLPLDRTTGQAAQRYIARAAKSGDEVAIVLMKQMKHQ